MLAAMKVPIIIMSGRRCYNCLPFLVAVVVICVVCSQQRVAYAFYASLSTTTTTRTFRFQSAATTNFGAYSQIRRGYHCHHSHSQLPLVRMNSDDAFDGTATNSTTAVPCNPQVEEFGSTTTHFPNSHAYRSTSVGRPRSTNSSNNRLSPLSLLPLSITKALPPPTTTTKGGGGIINWKERLVDISNIASLLCVLDCTILPLISIAIPLYSWSVGLLSSGGGGIANMNTASTGVMTDYIAMSAGGNNNNNWLVSAISTLMNSQLPSISHNIALYFVIPLGLVTSIVNYIVGHKQVRFTLLSFLGLVLIYIANSNIIISSSIIDITWVQHSWDVIISNTVHSHEHVHDACGAIVGAATGMLSHTCPSGEGLVHRLTNTLGCAFLLGSNYYGRKYSRGVCVANALSEAFGGSSSGGGDEDDEDSSNRNTLLCLDPRCIDPNCEIIFDANASGSSLGMPMEGENFFRWEKTIDQSNIDLVD